MLSPFSSLLRGFRRLSLAAVLLVTSLSPLLALAQQERPSVVTPWDDEMTMESLVIRTGEYEGALSFSPGSEEGDPVYNCTGLPPGLTLDKATGGITGTTIRAGYYTVTATVTVGG